MTDMTVKEARDFSIKLAYAEGNYQTAINMPTYKVCSICGESLYFVEFHSNTQNANGLHGPCRPCRRREENIRYRMKKGV